MNEDYRSKLKEWMGDWFPEKSTDSESTDNGRVIEEDKENQPSTGKHSKALSLSLKNSKKRHLQCVSGDKGKEQSNRKRPQFASPYSEQELDKLAEGLKPANTEASTQWAVTNFTKWAKNQRKLAPHDPVPGDLLKCHDPATVCKYLCMFIAETRKKKTTISIHLPQFAHCLVN